MRTKYIDEADVDNAITGDDLMFVSGKQTTVDALTLAIVKPVGTTATLNNVLESASGNTIYGFVDRFTGEQVTADKATIKADGTTITDQDVDNIKYFKLSTGEYFIRNGELNVLHFGADPTGVNDSSVAIQKCIDSLNKGVLKADPENQGNYMYGGGGVVYIPEGQYKMLSKVLIPSGVILKGTGINSTIIKSYVQNDNTFANKYEYAVYGTSGIVIEDIYFDGTNSVNSECIHYEVVNKTILKNVRIFNFKIGVGMNFSSYNYFYGVEIKGCTDWGLKMSVRHEVDTTTEPDTDFWFPCANNHFYGCYFSTNNKGILIDGGSNAIFGGTIQNNTNVGLQVGVDGGTPITNSDITLGTLIQGVHFEYHFSCNDIHICQNVIKTTIDTCMFYPSGEKTVRFIKNSGSQTIIRNSGNVTSNLVIGGSPAGIEQDTNNGNVIVEGGSFGIYLNPRDVVIGIPTNETSLAYRCKVTTYYDNDTNVNTSFAATARPQNLSIGYKQQYPGESEPRHYITSYNGIHPNASYLLGDGTGAPDTGIQRLGSKLLGVLDDNIFQILGARCTTTTAPIAPLVLGETYIWIDQTDNLRAKTGSAPNNSTDGDKVIVQKNGIADFGPIKIDTSGEVSWKAYRGTGSPNSFWNFRFISGTGTYGGGFSFQLGDPADIGLETLSSLLSFDQHKVGINNQTPAEMLDVVGNIKVSGTIISGNNIEITDLTKNFIGKSPDGTRRKLVFNNDGTVTSAIMT